MSDSLTAQEFTNWEWNNDSPFLLWLLTSSVKPQPSRASSEAPFLDYLQDDISQADSNIHCVVITSYKP